MTFRKAGELLPNTTLKELQTSLAPWMENIKKGWLKNFAQ